VPGESKSRAWEPFGFEHRYLYQRCDGCGLAYQKPRPRYDAEFVETAYEVYSTVVNEHWDGSQLTAQGRVVHGEYSNILNEIDGMISPARRGRSERTLLDIGCNTGLFLKAAKDGAWRETGVEISRTMVDLARRMYGVNALSGDWVPIAYPEKFDAIYCSHVIEHIPDPSAWMRRMREVLRPDGVICISVPNFLSIDRRYKRLLKRLGLRRDRWQAWQTPDHLYEPCEPSMRAFFEREGFEVVRTYTYPSEWQGGVSWAHRLMHFWLRWGAKARYFLKPRTAG